MKNLYIIISITTFLCFCSCKKDYELDEALLNEEILVPDFYVQGTLIDLENEARVPIDIKSNAEDIGIAPIVGSISYTGVLHGTKRTIVSQAGYNPRSGLSQPMNEDDKYLVNRGIRVKVVSALEGVDWDGSFTRDELLDLFQEGDVLDFGINAGEVEVSFHHDNIEPFPEFELNGYRGHSVPNPNSSLEILKVEEHVLDEINFQTGQKLTALNVTVNINCRLISFNQNRLDLEDFEAKLLFIYD